jgi:peptidoglycan-associated lipoprotein
MFHRRSIVALVLIALLALVGAGCKKKPTTSADAEQPQPEATASAEPEPAEPAEPTVPEEDTTMVADDFGQDSIETAELGDAEIERVQGELDTIYFQFDSYELTEEQRSLLRRNAAVIQQHETLSVRVEGHCDERGTIEYNLALGERRASVVRDYLVSLGVEAGRIRIVSYGEERPADPGKDEEAWSQNRRAEFRLSS